ncbi:MAG: methyltetrahydrofolate cobalamin methyltransferase [Desulfobacteraceae bacterium]|nr:MAG: methyltetrahydrofolate cobalamin methyltransferase [Desulfobacteraceae bacterium]
MEIIGEKINTTRKAVEAAVRQRDAAFIQDLARRQAEAGAAYLDINSGLPLDPREEAADFEWLVPLIQSVADVPLCLDTAHPQVIEAGLRLHKGRAMINSVNGDPAVLESILPLAGRYQCKVIALTTSREKKIPANSAERLEIAKAIAHRAGEYGVPLEDIYFDPLVLSLATDQRNALVFLETLKAIKLALPGAKTVSGLSNISFGLPKRKLLNQAFLVLAGNAGMDAAIADPTDKALMAMVTATEALANKDEYCARYLQAFREGRLDL